MEKEKKFYIASDGSKTPMEEMEFTHLSNGLAKRYREIFESTDKDDFARRLQDINDIKEEMYRRINDFNDKLGK